MGIKVCKFGGTSMADGNIIRAAADIVNADPERRFVVVSAPGKRFGGDTKVTDLLYRCHELASSGEDFGEPFSKIRARFEGMEKELGKEMGMRTALDGIEAEIGAGAGRDYCASRGEYLAARVMAAVLDVPFVDAKDIILFSADGTLSEETYPLASSVLRKYPRAVIPGFYGRGADGEIRTFSRGGSDISGAVVARAVKASLYENWTDVSGFFACDPRIVPSPECIREVSYQELRELSYMGANVLHSESIFPVRSAGIPIRICNTFRPADEGTLIVSAANRKRRGQRRDRRRGKTGFYRHLSGKIHDERRSGVCGEGAGRPQPLRRFLRASAHRHRHPVRGHRQSLSAGRYPGKDRGGYPQGGASRFRAHARGHRARRHGGARHGEHDRYFRRLFKALSDAGINVIMIDQGSSELNIIVGVDNADCAGCIRAIYREFFG